MFGRKPETSYVFDRSSPFGSARAAHLRKAKEDGCPCANSSRRCDMHAAFEDGYDTALEDHD